MVWLIVNAVRYVVNKIRGKDEDGEKEGSNANKCVLAGDKGENKNAPFTDIDNGDKAPLSTDSSVAKQPCSSPGGWG